MNKRAIVLGLLNEQSVDKAILISKVLATQTANLIGCWPLNEGFGTLVDDKSSQENNGTYIAGLTWSTGIGDGNLAPVFPGTSRPCNLFTAALASDFSGAEGTLITWIKITDAATWTDGTNDIFALLRVNDSNYIRVMKTSLNAIEMTYIGGGTVDQINILTPSSAIGSAWAQIAVTWSASNNRIRIYLNGQLSETGGMLGTFTGTMTAARLGSNYTDDLHWKGQQAQTGLWTIELTATEIRNLLTPSDLSSLIIHQIDPDSLSNQYSWHDFSDINTLFQDVAKSIPVTSDVDPIRLVVDKFADADNLTAPSDAVRPLYKTNIQNSLSVGLWNGVDTRLDHTLWANVDFTAFFVCKNFDTSNGSHVEYGGGYFAVTGAGYDVGNPYAVLHLNTTSDAISSTSGANTDVFHIIEITKSGAVWTLRIDGLTAGTMNVTGGNFWGPTSIGPESIANWWFDGYLAERIRYTTVLGAKTIASIRYELAEKWGLTNVSYGVYLRGD